MSQISQKEYLKKYLSIGKAPGEKKKKKKHKSGPNRIKLIDDNLDTYTQAVQEDLLGDAEDAPQIVAVIDERPHSIQTDDKTNANLWIPIARSNEENTQNPLQFKTSFKIGASTTQTRTDKDKSKRDDQSPRRKDKLSSKGSSPKRKSKRSPERDISPPRKQSNNDSIENKSDRDVSPPRKPKKIDDDYSPPRKSSRKDDDYSPPRKNNKKRDYSPPRKSVKKDDDYSPPRKSSKKDDDYSPPRKNSKKKDDYSPLRKSSRRDNSPSRRYKNEKPSSSKYSQSKNDYQHRREPEPRKKSRFSSISPQRKTSPPGNTKITKTLDGKKAGLQSAKELVHETRELKQKEEELFNNLSSEVSGKDASTIIRDRKTGKIRNLAEEAERDYEKQLKEQEREEKYSRWGRGLKQVEDANERVADELKEMSKPLARYADDEDLDKYLKEQERDGDPMLAYIRKKKKKIIVDEGKPVKPEYMGEFMPNRFGIRPGYRWDGVDRSCGYEKKWFEVQNAKTALREESYKWSTEDM